MFHEVRILDANYHLKKVVSTKELPPERLYFIHFFKGEAESPSVRDLLCFLKNKRSINYKSFKQLIFLFIEGKIDVDVL